MIKKYRILEFFFTHNNFGDKMLKKILFILLFSLNFFIQTSTTIILPTIDVNNSNDEFFEMISQYESFNEKLFDLYYQEYQVNNNIILSLNKVNYQIGRAHV